MCAKLFHATDTCQTLAYVIDGCSPSSVSLLSLFRGISVKVVETAAIEDDGGTRMATYGTNFDRILRNLLARRWSGHLRLVLKLPSVHSA